MQLKDLTRQLEKKTADELGEGAEVKLLEELKARFEGDNFHHVGKGIPAWTSSRRSSTTAKSAERSCSIQGSQCLAQRLHLQAAQGPGRCAADHAILSARVMPAGTKQMHIQDGIIIANPARVLTLVDSCVSRSSPSTNLRLSTVSKAEKTAELYTFMTSELCGQLFNQIEVRAADMEELDVKEKKRMSSCGSAAAS